MTAEQALRLCLRLAIGLAVLAVALVMFRRCNRPAAPVDVDQVKSAWPAATNKAGKPVAGEAGP